MTAAKELSLATFTKIQTRFQMQEVLGADGGPYIKLMSRMGPVGALRIFTSAQVNKMVYISMTVDAFGLDSHMIFAFTPPESAVPHFTLDSVMNGLNFAFHADLVPRVDLGIHLDYINTVFRPLDATFEAASQIKGLTPAHLTRTQYVSMSPWTLVYRANADAFAAIQAPVKRYLEHWCGLVERGLPADISNQFSPEQLAERDRQNRALIFNPEIDRVWAHVERLLGAEMGARMREILKRQDVEQ